MSIFNNGKYTKWYYNIIQRSMQRSVITYTEKHHIVPKSLGGDNSISNLAILTAREHFLCHLLLIKMVRDPLSKRKMQFALNSFRRSSSTQKRHKLNARQYEVIRKEVSSARSEFLKGNTYNLGKKRKPLSEETKRKIGDANRNRNVSNETRLKISAAITGKKRSEETKQKMRGAKTTEHRTSIRQARTGTTLSAATKEKISTAKRGQSYVKQECAHCKRMLDPGNYKKNHGEKCKLNPLP